MDKKIRILAAGDLHGDIAQAEKLAQKAEDEEVKYMLERSHKKIKDFKRKIMITHEHPTGSIIDKLIPNSGSKSIREAVDKFKPDFVLCGHIHEAAGIEEKIGLTTVINVGKAGKIIEL